MDNTLINIAIIIFAGVASQLLASKLKFPAIVPLLVIGGLLGQIGILNIELLGGGLQTIVHIGVAIILFEGGLSLRRVNYKEAPRTIRNLISVGLLITWVLGSAAAFFIFPELRSSTGMRIDILFGALITVTGPTVIMPLLKNVKIEKRLSTILTWEGILIDPIGAILAVVTLTFIETAYTGGLILREFFRSLAMGFSMGMLGGLAINYILNKRRWIPWDLRNLFVLSAVIVVYALSDWLQHETGVLAVTVAGIILGVMKPVGIDEIESFKGQLTTLMVSILFILLAANLNIQQIIDLGWRALLLLAAVIFIIRPINVFVSAIGSDLKFKEKLFLSWIAPRGIVAAAVASLFATNLSQIPGYETLASYIESLTFLVIAGTVFIQGGTARFVAKWLNVLQPEPTGFLFIGANAPARQLAKAIQSAGFKVIMMDINKSNCRAANKEGLEAIHADALDPDTLDETPMDGIGNLIAMTPNAEVNILACQQGAKYFGSDRVFRIRLQEDQEDKTDQRELKDEGILLFTEDLTFGAIQHRLSQGRGFFCQRTEEESVNVTPGGETAGPDTTPLFFVKNDRLELVTPNINIPSGAQTVCFGDKPEEIAENDADMQEIGLEATPPDEENSDGVN